MKHTDNFQMNKPEPTDYYDIDHFNDNIDIIDEELQANKEHRGNQENPHGVNKKQLGLDKVDNTSDADKPVSTLQRQAIDKYKTADTVTGTNPTITNSTDGNVIYLKNSGYTEQYSTAGNNLLAYNNVYRSFTAGQTFTQFGIVGNPFSKGAGTYNYSCSGDFGGAYNHGLWVYDKDNNLLLNISNIGAIGRAIEITEDVANNTVRVDVVVGGLVVGTAYSGYIYPQISYGATKLDYEPYCGGIPSPNPDYPQRIGSNADKGYFDGELLQGYRGASDGVYAWDNRHVTNTNGIECKSGDIIKIKYEEIPERLNLVFYDKDNVHISGSYKDNVNEHEATAPTNAKYVYFTVKQENITPSKAKHICVTINGMYALRVDTGNKNVLDIKEENSLITSTDGTIISQNGCAYAIVDVRNWDRVTLQGDFTLLGNSVLRVGYCTKYPNVGVKATRDNWYGNNVYNVSAYNYLLLTFVPNGTSTTTDFINSFFLEYGSVTDATYELHQETTALIPVSSPLYDGDYIEVFADGSGREYHKMKSVVYDGSQSGWSQYNNEFLFTISDAKAPANNNNSVANLYCSHFTNTSRLSMGNGLCAMSSNNVFIIQDTNKFNTVDELNTWLQSNPIHVVHELATPTETPLTAEQVAEFMKLQTFKPVTNITADGEVTIRYYCNNDSGETVGMLHRKLYIAENKANNLEARVAELEVAIAALG